MIECPMTDDVLDSLRAARSRLVQARGTLSTFGPVSLEASSRARRVTWAHVDSAIRQIETSIQILSEQSDGHE